MLLILLLKHFCMGPDSGYYIHDSNCHLRYSSYPPVIATTPIF